MIEVPSFGPTNARLAVIAESPGTVEEREGRPLVGPTGQRFTRAVGGETRRAQVWTGNVSREKPVTKKESPDARRQRIARWRPALVEDLASLTKPRTLLVLGADALEAIVGVGGPQNEPGTSRRLYPGIMGYHGSAFTRGEVDAIRAGALGNGVPVVPDLPRSVHTVVASLHPAFAMHGAPQFYPSIATSIARAAAWSEREEGPARLDIEVDDLQAAPEYLEHHLTIADNQGETVALDIETRLGTYNITICGVYANGRPIVFTWSELHAKVLQSWFKRPGKVVGHNFQFDLRALAEYDIRPTKRMCLDSMVAGALLWPMPPDEKKKRAWLNLASCSARVLNDYAYHKKPDNPATQALYRASYPGISPVYHEHLYNALDNYYCHRLWQAERELLQQEGML